LAGKAGFGRRLFKGLLFVVIAWLAITAIPVLLMRWWHPFSSAFMVNASVVHWSEKDYRTRYTWVDLDAISPNAALAVIASEDQQFSLSYGLRPQVDS
jgi:monofunctional biosynthetic peptidoglycan transglycosylase